MKQNFKRKLYSNTFYQRLFGVPSYVKDGIVYVESPSIFKTSYKKIKYSKYFPIAIFIVIILILTLCYIFFPNNQHIESLLIDLIASLIVIIFFELIRDIQGKNDQKATIKYILGWELSFYLSQIYTDAFDFFKLLKKENEDIKYSDFFQSSGSEILEKIDYNKDLNEVLKKQWSVYPKGIRSVSNNIALNILINNFSFLEKSIYYNITLFTFDQELLRKTSSVLNNDFIKNLKFIKDYENINLVLVDFYNIFSIYIHYLDELANYLKKIYDIEIIYDIKNHKLAQEI